MTQIIRSVKSSHIALVICKTSPGTKAEMVNLKKMFCLKTLCVALLPWHFWWY
jgi:hypothetical protein